MHGGSEERDKTIYLMIIDPLMPDFKKLHIGSSFLVFSGERWRAGRCFDCYLLFSLLPVCIFPVVACSCFCSPMNSRMKQEAETNACVNCGYIKIVSHRYRPFLSYNC